MSVGVKFTHHDQHMAELTLFKVEVGPLLERPSNGKLPKPKRIVKRKLFESCGNTNLGWARVWELELEVPAPYGSRSQNLLNVK